MSLTLVDRQRNLQDQLRSQRSKLVEAQALVEALRKQCAHIEGALALCASLLSENGTAEDAPLDG